MTYRRRASALHAARAAAGCAYCGALAVLALASEHPLILLAVLLAVLGAGAAAGVLRELGRVARIAVPFAVLIALVNPLVVRDGLTVIFRGAQVPVLGRLDVTLEAAVYGGILGLRALIVMLCFGLYAAAIDPDEVLRLFRRVSFRSALTASLATRMVPVLARDGRRLADAQRCRPGPAPSRLALVRVTAAGALDRAIDVAAALELRGYGGARRPPRSAAPLSRHDVAVGAAAIVLVTLAVAAEAADPAPFAAYPRLTVAGGGGVWALAAAIVVAALAPFAERRGVGR